MPKLAFNFYEMEPLLQELLAIAVIRTNSVLLHKSKWELTFHQYFQRKTKEKLELVILLGLICVQWGSEIRPFENRIHSKSGSFDFCI